ncbi:DUF1453 domain-containing protein [Kitasatospora sp. NBC_01246]|uniref:DUF1453 domain-containing protein n=1 Tax=Kitasatospora sp. NBC_01246 TaxID=2903570 RepID=UPI002E3099F0|nr:DUF1453 domain-containing protein [Kitasatospora sp. NBC_01246]
MTGLVNVLVIIAVVALVLRRQLSPQRLDTERRFWVLPLVLAVLALRDPGLVDGAHRALSIGLTAASLLVVLAMGCVWGWTVRIWRGEDGALWTRATKATGAAWAGMVVVRIGLYGLGAALHVHQSGSALMLGLAALLVVRTVVVNWRARELATPYRAGVAG